MKISARRFSIFLNILVIFIAIAGIGLAASINSHAFTDANKSKSIVWSNETLLPSSAYVHWVYVLAWHSPSSQKSAIIGVYLDQDRAKGAAYKVEQTLSQGDPYIDWKTGYGVGVSQFEIGIVDGNTQWVITSVNLNDVQSLDMITAKNLEFTAH